MDDKFLGERGVYIANADNMSKALKNLEMLKTYRPSGAKNYITVIGGLCGLNYIAALHPDSITFFDINPEAVPYGKFIIELVKKCNTQKEFITRIFCRSVVEFENTLGTEASSPYLSVENQSAFLDMPVDESILSENMGLLSEASRETFTKYIIPRLRCRELPGIWTCRRMLPCWDPDKEVPVGPGTGLGVNNEGELVPNTNAFFYGYGWLENESSYKATKDALQHADIRWRVMNLLTAEIKEWLTPGQSNVLYASNINDFFPNEWRAWQYRGFQAASRVSSDCICISSYKGIFPIRVGTHCLSYEAVAPHVFGRIIEVTHKEDWGFHEFSPETVVVKTYLKNAINADTIILHILLGNKIPLDTTVRVVEKSIQECNILIILEHDPSSLDWHGKLATPSRASVMNLLRLCAQKYGKHVVLEEDVAGELDGHRNYLVVLR